MIVSKINYEQLFPNPFVQFGNIRFGMDITLQEGDSIADAYTKAHKEANDNFNRLFPQVVGAPMTDFNTGEAVRQPERVATSMADDIKTCKDLKVLSTYKLLVKNKKDLQEIFDQKLLELSK